MRYFILLSIFYLAKLLLAEFFYKPYPTELLITGRPKDVRVPWMGILRVKQNFPLTDAVANVILIAKTVAISNANEIHDLDQINTKNTTSVNFYSDPRTLFKCYVEEYIIHPEFHTGKINTVGLIQLGTEQVILRSLWKPVKWPKTYFNTKDGLSIFSVGFSDQTRTLEQVMYKMETVDFINCTYIYIREGMNFPTIWPKYYTCFRAKEQLETCVYDAGMAVASNTTGEWTLIGISIYGPGCSFPARFIEFYPYIPWIQETLKSMLPERDQYTRRTDGSAFYNESYRDLDREIMNNLDNAQIAMDTTETNKEVVAFGNCSDKTVLIYREDGHFKLRKGLQVTTALYSVTISLEEMELVCITTMVKCKRKSKTQVYTRKGFEQEDVKFFIQRVPEYKLGTKTFEDRVLYLEGGYRELENMSTVTIWFKFEITSTASIKVAFYGNKVKKPAVARTKRPRPTYSPRINKQFATTKKKKSRRIMVKSEDNIQQDYYEPETETKSLPDLFG